MEFKLAPALAVDLVELVEGEVALQVRVPDVDRARTLVTAEFQIDHRSRTSRSPNARVNLPMTRKSSPHNRPRPRRPNQSQPHLESSNDSFEVDVVEQGDDDLWIAPADRIADRAYRVAIVGLMVWPLQAYALFLSLQNCRNASQIGRDRRNKAIAAGIVSAIMCWLMAIGLVKLFLG